MENNLVYNVKTGGFHQHYGKENIIRNNILAFSKLHQIQATRVEKHLSFTFENNIVYWDEGTLTGTKYIFIYQGKPISRSNWEGDKYELDYNIYYNPEKDSIMFMNWTFEEWQKRGNDVHSLIADPLFVNPYNYNFTLKPESPAFELGFRQIDMSTVGPR